MTKKQRLFFKELLYSKSNSEAARKAGYSESSARVSAHRNITKYNEFLLSVLIEADIDIHSLGQALGAGLKSNDENVKFKYLKLALSIIDRAMLAKKIDTSYPEKKRDTPLTEHEKRIYKKYGIKIPDVTN